MDEKRLAGWLDEVRGLFYEAAGRRREREKIHAPRFNVFQILGIQHKELHHSSFLAELLDPSGSHGQGDLFLRGFLDLLRASGDSDAELELGESGRWHVAIEETCEEGRLDIVLRSPSTVIAIENKIYAAEGNEQLKRYQRWLSRQSDASHTLLVYLTLDGREAWSMQGVESKYRRLSYAEHILPWLEVLSGRGSEIEAASVRSLLTQYVDTLRDLTGGSETMDVDENIVELLSKPANLEVALQIPPAVQEVKRRLHERFWAILIEEIRKKLEVPDHWSIHPPVDFEKDPGPWLGVYHSAAYDPKREPSIYISAQILPHEVQYGVASRDKMNAGYQPREAAAKLRSRVPELTNTNPWWLAFGTCRMELAGDGLLRELARSEEPLPIVHEIASKLAPIMNREGVRDLLIKACAEMDEGRI